MFVRQAGPRLTAPVFTRWCLLAWCCIASCFTSAAIAADTTPLRVAYIPVVTWLPVLVAKDNGYFEKQGLDVTLTRVPSILNLPATVGRQFDLVPTTAPDFISAAASGQPVAAVAGEAVESTSNKTFLLLVRPDGSIKSVRDLKGKRVASPGVGSVMHIALLHWFKQQGGDPATLSGVEMPFPGMMDQLKAGHVDAVEQLEPYAGQMLQQGYVSLGAPLLAVADPVLFPFWIAQLDWSKNHRDVLKKWKAALTDARTFIRDQDAASRAILAKYSGLPAAVVASVPMPAFDFNIAPAQLEVWRQVMMAQGRPLQKLAIEPIVVTAE